MSKLELGNPLQTLQEAWAAFLSATLIPFNRHFRSPPDWLGDAIFRVGYHLRDDLEYTIGLRLMDDVKGG
jgi:hypothetical protein